MSDTKEPEAVSAARKYAGAAMNEGQHFDGDFMAKACWDLLREYSHTIDRLNAQAKRIAELEDILAEVTNELQYMYASYHSHVRERGRREDEELIRRANKAIGENDGA